jgi:hypothetical protein
VYTDGGRPIAIHSAEIPDPTEVELQAEDAWLKAQRLDGPVVRTGNPGPYSNCYGWIFTGGRYTVDTGIEIILDDNRYEPVAKPRPDDLVVYTVSQTIVHVAIVRDVPATGDVIVESKWGARGRYHHPVRAYPLPAPYQLTYYRSPRRAHLLRGLFDEEVPSDTSTAWR